MTSMDDDLIGRQPQLKTTTMEDDLNGRQPQWKTTSREEVLRGRTPLWKSILMEVDPNRSLQESDDISLPS